MHIPEPDRRLIDTLKNLQQQEGLTGKDVEWAARLGISQGHWSKLRNYQRGIGKRFGTRVVRRYPHLWREVLDCVLPVNMQDGVCA